MSTNLEYGARERQRKRESRRQDNEAQREKGRQRSGERDQRKKEHFLLEEQNENFVAAVTKGEMLPATNTKWKEAAVKKKVNENTFYISSKKRVTTKFLEVSRCSRAKRRQRNVQKMCAARGKLLFYWLDLLLFFTVLRHCFCRLALHNFIICF